MSDTESDQGRQITVSLSDPICSDYPSSSDSDWTDTDSETSSIMAGSKDKGKVPSRRVRFGEGSSSRPGEASVNRGASASSSRHHQVPGNQAAAAAAEPTNATATQQTGAQNTANPAPTNTNPGVPGVQPYNNPAPITSTGQPLYTHHTGQRTLNQYQHLRGTTFAAPGQPFGNPNGYITGYPRQHVFVATPTANNMSGYIQPPNTGIHFQPQVPDTTNGPYLHTYHPRHDAQGQMVFLQPCAVGAPVYVYQPSQIQALRQPTIQPVVYQMQAPPQAQTCHHTCYQYASVTPSIIASFGDAGDRVVMTCISIAAPHKTCSPFRPCCASTWMDQKLTFFSHRLVELPFPSRQVPLLPTL